MCRWAAYRGDPLYLEELVSSPAHSLIEQSHCATRAKTATNGDGFGIAWYGDRPEPGRYRDILPAWSDCNLKSLARQIRSPLFLAHVRAATGGGTRRDNCHPFTHESWSFMHNGQISGFERLRRPMEAMLDDDAVQCPRRHHRFRADVPAGAAVRSARGADGCDGGNDRLHRGSGGKHDRLGAAALYRCLLRRQGRFMPSATRPIARRRRFMPRRSARAIALCRSR